MISSNFAVIYRFYLLPEKEEEYRSNWNRVAHYFVENRGALGSSLHKTESGYWLAYSKWPDKKTRDASWSEDAQNLPECIQEAISVLKSCQDPNKEPFLEICMSILDQVEILT